MKSITSGDAPFPMFESLEPRLMLSVSGLLNLESVNLGNAPQSISADLLPEYKQEDSIISSHLRQVREEIEEFVAADPDADLSAFSNWTTRIKRNGDIQVYVHVDVVNDVTVQNLEAAGLSFEISSDRTGVVQGWVHYSSLDTLASIEGVHSITPPGYAVTNTGSVTTAGDGISNADDLRNLFGGVTGVGVKIGVISDGVDHWQDVAADPYNDLPDSITIHSTFSGSGDEGTAMLEIVHDLAPDADLYFAGYRSNGNFSSADMESAIEWLVNQGCDVIVDRNSGDAILNYC